MFCLFEFMYITQNHP
jgi:predicted  nucleic acid-binding Zn-ribbon protein